MGSSEDQVVDQALFVHTKKGRGRSNHSPKRHQKGQKKDYFQVHTNLAVIEDTLQNLYQERDENLAFLLTQSYRASYFPKYFKSDPLTVDLVLSLYSTPPKAESSTIIVAPLTPIQTIVSLPFISLTHP